jgi:hypothetical protein
VRVKITALRTEIVRLPLPRPILSATLEIRSTDAVLVFVDTDQGVTGEATDRLEVLRRVRFAPMWPQCTVAVTVHRLGVLDGALS